MKTGEDRMVSVIICTIGRPGFLARTVDALLKGQSYRNFEIIIIDQSDETARGFTGGLPDSGKIRHFRSGRKGVPDARNEGISKARGDIFLFLDDDVDIASSPDLIRFHAAAYDREDIGGVGGSVFQNKPVNNTSLPGARVSASGRVMMNFESGRAGFIESSFGANMSFSRKAAMKTGGFDRRYAGASLLEETDFCYRVRAAGYRILYEPGAHLIHLAAGYGGCRQDSPASLLYWRLHNTALFCCKHMNKLRLPYIFAVHLAIAVKQAVCGKIAIKELPGILKAFFKGAGTGLTGRREELGMRIGIDATSLCRKTTGIEKYTLRIVENILRLGKDGRYVVFLRGGVPPELEKVRGHNTFAVSPFRSQFLCEQLWLPLACAVCKADLVFFPAFPPGLLVSRRFVPAAHDASVWKFPEYLSWKARLYFRPMLIIALKRARRIITVSSTAAGDIAAAAGVDKARFSYAYSAAGPEFSVVEDRGALEKTRTKYKLPTRFILHAGSIEPRKNLPFLLRVFAKATEINGMNDFSLILAGRKAWGINQVEREIERLGLEKRVFLTGYVSDEELCRLYNLAHVFVFPSVYEGFGLPVLEAMACGLPVVASNIPAHLELFSPAILSAKPDDEEDFAARLTECALDRSLRRKLAREGFKKSKEFSWSSAAGKVLSVLESQAREVSRARLGKNGKAL